MTNLYYPDPVFSVDGFEVSPAYLQEQFDELIDETEPVFTFFDLSYPPSQVCAEAFFDTYQEAFNEWIEHRLEESAESDDPDDPTLIFPSPEAAQSFMDNH